MLHLICKSKTSSISAGRIRQHSGMTSLHFSPAVQAIYAEMMRGGNASRRCPLSLTTLTIGLFFYSVQIVEQDVCRAHSIPPRAAAHS